MTPAEPPAPGLYAPSELPRILLAQWHRLCGAAETVDPETPCGLPGWRNKELLAHLTVQPHLLAKFLAATPPEAPGVMTLEENLAGTRALSDRIDAAVKDAASHGRTDLPVAVAAVTDTLLAADVNRVVVTIQGPLRLSDYLVTRCVEAVVHGLDLDPPTRPDPEALAVADAALRQLAATSIPTAPLPDDALEWVLIACGRRPPPPSLDPRVTASLPITG